MAMDPRPLDPSRPLEVDAKRDAELESKRQLRESDSDVVLATNLEGDEASAEILGEVRALLAAAHSRAPDFPTV